MIDQIYLPDCPHLPACPTFLRSFFISHPNFENTLISCAFLSKSWNDRLKASNDFKNKQKSVWRNAFWYSKVCIFWKFIQYTIHGDETQMLKKKIPSGKINSTKNVLIFLSRAPTHHSFTFNLQFLYELKHKVRLSKTVWDFPFSIPFIYFYQHKV